MALSETTARFIEPPPRPSRLGILVAVSIWSYLIALVGLWLLLRWADLWWPATFLMFAPRWPAVLPVVVLLPAALLFRRRSLLPLSIATYAALGPVSGFCVPWRQVADFGESPGTRLRVLTCNVHYREPDLGRLRQLLDETQPDIVTFQEWPNHGPADFFDSKVWSIHRAPHLFLASRYPISDVVEVTPTLKSKHGAALSYHLETPFGPLTLFNLHFASPRHALYNVLHDPEKGAAQLREGSDHRWEQSEAVALAADEVKGPVLLAGDFNTPPESAIFRQLWSRYTDAFSTAGWGWGYTFHGGKTWVRIDHILAGPGWHCNRCWMGADIGSPHRPVIADLNWR